MTDRVRVIHGDSLDVLPQLLAEGVRADGWPARLAALGIEAKGIVRVGVGRTKRASGDLAAIIECDGCGVDMTRRVSELVNLRAKRGTREFFCSRGCKTANQIGGVVPPPLPMPDFLKRPIKATSELEIGKAAEHFVCAELILDGYRAYLSDQGLPYDIVADVDGRLIRIQVKATTQWRRTPKRTADTPAYFWHAKRAGKKGRRSYGAREFEMIAFVALDIRCVAYRSIGSVVKQCVALRPPGTPITHKNKTLKNIDQYPFDDALAEILRG